MSTTMAYDAGKTRIYGTKGLAIARPQGPQGAHGWARHSKTLPFIPAPPVMATSEAPEAEPPETSASPEPPPSKIPTRPPLAVASMLVLTFAGLAASIGMAVEAML